MKNVNRIETMFDADALKKEACLAQGKKLHDEAIGQFILGLFRGNAADAERASQPGVITVFDIQNKNIIQAGSPAA